MKLEKIQRPKTLNGFQFIGFRYWKKHDWDYLPDILGEYSYHGLTLYKIGKDWFKESENS